MSYDDTIAAIATPPGEGGVGIIRVSGPEAIKIAQNIWQGRVGAGFKPAPTVHEMQTHRLFSGSVIDPNNDSLLDTGLITVMRAPHSYTGEDVVELQLHGSPSLLDQILQMIIKLGARLARPGEYTERAFLNGKMDLVQAEAVADLIASQSELGIRLARDQLSGTLSQAIKKIRNELVVMRAQLEAMIEFPDDEDVTVLRFDEIRERLAKIMGQMKDWLLHFDEGRLRREGARVVLAGRPNVGKSSLMNALLKENRVIVHEQAGTTRDVVEEAINLNGLLIRLSDTAGLHEGQEAIEEEGIRRTWERVSKADLICFVVDGSEKQTEQDRQIDEQILSRRGDRPVAPTLVLMNKIDLCRGAVSAPEEKGGVTPPLRVSAKTGEGIEQLKASIREMLLPQAAASDQVTLANQRHKICLDKTLEALTAVDQSAAEERSLEFLAADLLVACNHLGEITGEITHDEVLSEIFSHFCIGK